jgi:hypothetical protein
MTQECGEDVKDETLTLYSNLAARRAGLISVSVSPE